MASIPQSIMPKFLWKYVIDYLPYHSIIKLIAVNKHYEVMMSVDDWKHQFIRKRESNIAIVKCASKQMDNFWRYALENEINCDSIRDLFQFLDDDNTSDSFIYYKIFIKNGEYPFINHRSVRYILCKKPCSIEINGDKHGTTIRYDSNVDNGWQSNQLLNIVASKYFSIKNIRFHNLQCHCDKYYIYGENMYAMCNTKIHVSNCIFDGKYCYLDIESINKTYITHCQFNRHGITINNSALIRNILKCIISHSIFSVKYECAYSNVTGNAIIRFTNNYVAKADSVYAYFGSDSINDKSVLIIDNNNISNVNHCILYGRNTIINDNYFNNMFAIHDESIGTILNDNNRFENCGEKCMEQVHVAQLKIENARK